MREAMGTILAACTRHGVACGLHLGDAALLRQWAERGARFITYSSDIGFVQDGLREGIRRLKANG